VLLKCVLPERLTCVAVDRRGHLCAGGTAQGRVYLWEVRVMLADSFQAQSLNTETDRVGRVVQRVGCTLSPGYCPSFHA
jgi:hypothetical protein